MSDCVDDYYSAIGLIIEEYQYLHRLNPKHPLLKLICNVDEGGFEITKNFDEKYNSFGDNHKSETGKFTAKGRAYLRELTNSVTDELKKLLSLEKGKGEDEIWKKMKERRLEGVIRTHLTYNQYPLISFVE